MGRKVPESEDFYEVSLCSNTTVSTWLDYSGSMSRLRQIASFVRGNSSTAFSPSKMPFFNCTRMQKQVRELAPTYYTKTHSFSDRLKASLRGNKNPSSQPSCRRKRYLPFPCPDTGSMIPCSAISFKRSEALDDLMSITFITSDRPKII